MVEDPARAGPIGRAARLVLGACLVVIALPVYFDAGASYVVSSLGLTAGLLAFYSLLHFVASRMASGLNRWVGAVVAATPVVLVWYFGQGGGPLFGQGEGGTAAITYLAASFLVDFARGNSGCEVMAIPGLLFGRRTHLPCLMLCPIDHMEAAAVSTSSAMDRGP